MLFRSVIHICCVLPRTSVCPYVFNGFIMCLCFSLLFSCLRVASPFLISAHASPHIRFVATFTMFASIYDGGGRMGHICFPAATTIKTKQRSHSHSVYRYTYHHRFVFRKLPGKVPEVEKDFCFCFCFCFFSILYNSLVMERKMVNRIKNATFALDS